MSEAPINPSAMFLTRDTQTFKMDEDQLIRDELEHLAQAYTAADADLGEPIASEQRLNGLDISADAAIALQSALRSSINEGGPSKPKEQTAFVSVPDGLPADFLFRLEPPVETPDQLDQVLGLPKGTLQSVTADRTGEEGEQVENVQFVFVDKELKESIAKWIEEKKIGITPLFVTLTKTTKKI